MSNLGWNDLSQAAEYLTLELGKEWTEQQVLYACEKGILRLHFVTREWMAGLGSPTELKVNQANLTKLDVETLRQSGHVSVTYDLPVTHPIWETAPDGIKITSRMTLDDLRINSRELEVFAANEKATQQTGQQSAANTKVVTNPPGTSGNLKVFRAMEKLTADEVSIAFVGDKFDFNSTVGSNSFLEISARNVARKIALSKLDLVNVQSGGLNVKGVMLLGMAHGKNPSSTDANGKTISRLREILQQHLGVKSDPFDPKDVKWAPRFTITDKRGAADERAKQDALKYKTDSYEQLNEFGKEAGGTAKNSYSTEPLHESSDMDDMATKFMEEN